MRALLGLAMAATMAACTTTTPIETNKQTAVAAMNETLGALDSSKVDQYFADPYIQHNPMLGSGVDSLKGLINGLASAENSAFGLQTVRVLGEGDLVAMHNVWNGFGPVPLVAFDVFRFNDEGKIVEHWDNLTPLAEKPNPSGRTQIDGATEITDLDKTAANKAIVLEFIERGLIKGEQIDFTQYINPQKYLQHNSDVADGLEGFGAFFAMLAEKGIEMRYTKVGLVVTEGNFVLTGSEGSFGGKPTAFYDLFRLEEGKIVEHWDVIADMPSGDLPEGYPGKF